MTDAHDLEAAFEEGYQAGIKSAQSGWQTMETAPKTGLVDLYCDHGDGIQTRVPAAYWYDGKWWASTGPIRLPWVVTHWMKYPEPPSQQ